MNIIQETLKQGITKDSVKSLDDADERLKVWTGRAQDGLEPNYELLKKHLEVWIKKSPENSYKMAEFLVHRKETLANNFNDLGSSKKSTFGSSLTRKLCEIPPDIFRIFSVLAPNFLGAEELTAETRKKRVHLFLKHFPVFQACRKI
jgi:hypothetical protein